MLYRKLNIFYTLLISAITLISCNTPQGVLNSVEDDVYFSRKATSSSPRYVPEVDVNEIIKKNPPQYGEGREIEPEYQPNNYNYNSGTDYTNPNAASGYQRYKAEQDALQQDEQNNNDQFLSTVPYSGYEEEASEASLLRRQYAGNYGGYFARPSRYNSWARPSLSIGWNMFTGFGVGMGWGNGFNTGWNTGYGYGWPHYNTYCDPFWTYGNGYSSPWGYSPYNNWGYNSWGYNPWGYNGYYGYNNYYGYQNRNYVGGWGYNQYENNNNTPAKTYRPRGQGAGTSIPRGTDGGRVVTPRQGQVGVENPQQNQGRVVVPRSSSEGQLINRDGQPVYVAPNQNRNNTPRSYNSYPKSVEQERNYRDVAPAPRPQVPQTRPSTPQRDYTAPVQDRNEMPRERYTTPPARNTAPSRDNTPARNYSPSPSPSRGGGGTVSPPSGGSRGSSGGGSAPRSRPR